MSQTTARITEVVVTLNQCIHKLSDNDTVEFDIEEPLNRLEGTADTLLNEIEESIEFNQETSG
jgi:hypothetical protein